MPFDVDTAVIGVAGHGFHPGSGLGRTDGTTINSRTDYGGEKDAVESSIAGANGTVTFFCIEGHDSSLHAIVGAVSPFSAMKIITEVVTSPSGREV